MKQITELLETLNRGEFKKVVEGMLSEVLRAVEDTQGQGAITITLRVVPNEDGTAMVRPECKAKRPQKKQRPDLFFVHEGELHKDSPRQVKLGEVRDISEGRKAAKEL